MIERADTCQGRSGNADSAHSQDLPARISSQMTRHHATRVSSSDAALLALRRSADAIFLCPAGRCRCYRFQRQTISPMACGTTVTCSMAPKTIGRGRLGSYLAHLCSWLTSTQQRLPPAMLETPSLVLANRPSSLLQGRKLRANLDRQSVPSPMAHAPLLQ